MICFWVVRRSGPSIIRRYYRFYSYYGYDIRYSFDIFNRHHSSVILFFFSHYFLMFLGHIFTYINLVLYKIQTRVVQCVLFFFFSSVTDRQSGRGDGDPGEIKNVHHSKSTNSNGHVGRRPYEILVRSASRSSGGAAQNRHTNKSIM